MAELISTYYQETADCKEYCNPIVEECLRDKKSIYQLSPEQVDASVMYHLSPERQNILLWYPFDASGRVLEVGAGSGSLTTLLCEKTNQVDSFDLSAKNCHLNLLRNGDKANLSIFPGSPFSMDGQEQYDYIVVNDDLKNAGRYFSCEAPYSAYIQGLKKFLKPMGHMLLSVGNRLALKYLAGAPDECSGRYFESINRYPNDRDKREFSRSELLQLVDENDLKICQWYYPYPNQTFPNEIFTSGAMATYGYGRKYNNYATGRLELFREDLLAKDLIREKTIETFANGFLLDIVPEESQQDVEMFYVKLNGDRKKEFCIYTAIVEKNGEKWVEKKALNTMAQKHLKHLFQYEKEHQGGMCSCLAGEWKQDGICYPFLNGKSMDAMVESKIANHRIRELLDGLQDVLERSTSRIELMGEQLYSEEFQKIFGSDKVEKPLECIRPANIDLILGNVFEREQGYLTIDNEWIFDIWIPNKFILWRGINELIYAHPTVEDVMSREEMYDYFEITKSEAIHFDMWNHHFVENYVQANRLYRYSIEPQKVSLERDLDKKTGITSTLYLDYGQGLSEEHRLQSFCLLEEGRFRVSYDIPNWKNLKDMRWDPLEGSFCDCQVWAVQEKKEPVRLKAKNSCGLYENRDSFATIDPQYFVETSCVQGGRLVLQGNIYYLSNQQVEQRLIASKNLIEKLGKKWEKIKHR